MALKKFSVQKQTPPAAAKAAGRVSNVAAKRYGQALVRDQFLQDVKRLEQAETSAQDEVARREQGLSYNDQNLIDRVARGETPKVVRQAQDSAARLAALSNSRRTTEVPVATVQTPEQLKANYWPTKTVAAPLEKPKESGKITFDPRVSTVPSREQWYDYHVQMGRDAKITDKGAAEGSAFDGFLGAFQSDEQRAQTVRSKRVEGNRVTGSRELDNDATQSEEQKAAYSGYDPNARYLTDDEADYYSFLRSSANEATADQWLATLSVAIEKRKSTPRNEWVSHNPYTETAYDAHVQAGRKLVDFEAFAKTDNTLPSYMNEDEKEWYAYTLGKFGQDEADAYYETLRGELNRRKYDPYRKSSGSVNWKDPYGTAINAVDTAAGVANNVVGGLIGGVGDAWEYLTTGKVDPYSENNKRQHIGTAQLGGVSDTIDNKVLKTAYQIGGSVAETAITTAISIGIGNIAGVVAGAAGGAIGSAAKVAKVTADVTKVANAALNSSRVFAGTVQGAIERGVDDGKAVTLGLISAAVEGLTETWSLSKFLDDPANLLHTGISNAQEEVSANILNTIADVVVTKDKSEWMQTVNAYMAAENMSESEAFATALWDKAKELGIDGIGGFVSGATLSAPSAIDAASTKRTAKRTAKLTIQNRIQTALVQNGYTAEDAVQLAEPLASVAMGDTISARDHKRISKDETTLALYNQMIADTSAAGDTTTARPEAVEETESTPSPASPTVVGNGRVMPDGTMQIAKSPAELAAWQAEAAALQSPQNENTAEDGGERYSIVVLENGNVYVDASRNVITGKTLNEQRNEVSRFFDALLSNRESLDIPTIEGDVLTITREETANKARDNYWQRDGKREKMSPTEFALKARVETHIDEIAEVSTEKKGKSSKRSDEKSHSFAKDGFTYRRAYFRDFDGQYYEITLSVGKNGDTATVYNVGKIEGSVLPAAKIIAASGSMPIGKTTSTKTISQPAPVVNPQAPVLQSTATTNGGNSNGTNVSDGNEGRPAGVGAGGQTGSVRSGAEGGSARAAALRNRLEEHGVRTQSTRSLGISRGTDTLLVREAPQTLWDDEMREADRRVYSVTGKHLRFVVGGMEIHTTDDNTRTIRGVRTDTDIIVQADHPCLTPTKIALHEMFHELVVQYPQLRARAIDSIRGRFTPQQIDEIQAVYDRNLKAVYDTEAEIFDEMLADAYAEINAFDANAPLLTEAVQNATDTTLGEGRPAPTNAAPRAPPQNGGERMSVETVDTKFSEAEIQAIQQIGRKSVNAFTSKEVATTEKFARKYQKELGTKSPFFRLWFGEWRANDTTPVKVADQQGDTRGVQKNEDTGWDIQVSAKVFNETKVHTDSYNIAARPYLPFINDIVKKAVLLDSFGVDLNKSKSPDSLLMHNLYVVVDIGKGPEVLKLYVEEMNNPNIGNTGKRAYQLQNIEKYQSTGKSSQNSASSISPAAGTIKSVADLYAFVKQYDRSLSSNDPGDLTNADGTPRVFYVGTDDPNLLMKNNVSQNGIYLAKTEDEAKQHGEHVISVYTNARNTAGTRPQYIDYGNGSVWMYPPAQIKSATDNIGTFDGDNPDVHYSVEDTILGMIDEITDEPSAEDGAVPVGVDVHDWEAKMNARADEKKRRRLETISRDRFAGSPALQKLDIRVEGTVTDYDDAEYLRQVNEAFKDLERDTKKLERRLGATSREKRQAALLADGEILPSGIHPAARANVVKLLAEQYSYKRAMGENSIRRHKRVITDHLDEKMENLFHGVDKIHKPSKTLVMNYRTPRRNMIRMFGDERGDTIYREVFAPVVANEAERLRFSNRMLNRVRTFKGTDGKTAELTEAERAVAQVQLEGNAVATEIAKMEKRSRVEAAAQNLANGREGYDVRVEGNLTDAEFAAAKRLAWWLQAQEWIATQTVDQTRVDNAVKEYSKVYDELYDAINDFLVVHGYEPIGFVKGYAPHFQKEKTLGTLQSVLQRLGVNADVGELPASIAGLTSEFKPGHRWDPHFQTRRGNNTDYDIAYGFESYIEYISDVFFHTDDIMRIRRASTFFRTEYSSENISNLLDQVKNSRYASVEEKRDWLVEQGVMDASNVADAETVGKKMDEYVEKLYENLKTQERFSEFVKWLDNYANILAGKQSMADRGWEWSAGRGALNIGNKAVQIFARSNIAANLSSALNQTAQLPTIIAECGAGNVSRAVRDILTGKTRRAMFFEGSDFVVGKKGVRKLTDTTADKALEMMFKPIEAVDRVLAEVAVRASYLKQLGQGQSHEAALKAADRYAAKTMGSRMKGEKPMMFQSKSIGWQMVNIFQVEALNSWEHITQDLPQEFRAIEKAQGKRAAAKRLAQVIFASLLWAFLLNRLSEELYGGTPAPFDLLGLTANFIASGEGVTVNEGMGIMIDNAWERLFGSRLFNTDPDAVRDSFDTGAAVEDTLYNVSNEIPFVRNVAGLMGWGDNTMPMPDVYGAGKKVVDSVKNSGLLSADTATSAGELIAQFLPGGRQAKKTVQGIATMARGGAYKGDRLQYPVDGTWDEWIRGVMFGKSGLSETNAFYASGASGLSKKQTALYKSLVNSGADRKAVYDTISEVALLKDSGAKRETITATDFSDEQKAELYIGLVGSEKKIRSFLEDGMSWEKIAEALETEASAEKYADLSNAGLDHDVILKVSETIGKLVPEEGKKSVTSYQRQRAIIGMSMSEEEKMLALSAYMPESTYRKLEIVSEYDVTPTQWVNYFAAADKDESGKISQMEANMYLKTMTSLNSQQRAALWQATNPRWDPKNNPFNKSVSFKVQEALEEE